MISLKLKVTKRIAQLVIVLFAVYLFYIFIRFTVELAIFLSITVVQKDAEMIDKKNSSEISRVYANFESNYYSLNEAWNIHVTSEPKIRGNTTTDPLDKIVFIIKSTPNEQPMRHVIRTTWGSTFKERLVFVMADSRPTGNLWREIGEHGDILLLHFTDSRRNLTLKTIQAWKYMAKLKQENDFIDWFFYMDSDVYVLADNLGRMLTAVQGQRNTMYGKLIWHPLLKKFLAEYASMIGANHVPYVANYPTGAMVLLTAGVPHKLNAAMKHLPPIVGLDDLYTGLLGEFSQVRLIPDTNGYFCWFWPSMVEMALHEYFCNYGKSVAVCELKTPNQMRSFSRHLPNLKKIMAA